PVSAEDKVCYAGDAGAVAVGTSRYVACDAADAIEVDYDPLEAAVDVEKAAEAGAPILFEEFGTNVAFRLEMPNPAVDQAFRSAEKVVKIRIEQQRLLPAAMEPRASAAQWEAGTRQLTLWSSTQIPHLLRTQLAEALKLPESRVRVIAPE